MRLLSTVSKTGAIMEKSVPGELSSWLDLHMQQQLCDCKHSPAALASKAIPSFVTRRVQALTPTVANRSEARCLEASVQTFATAVCFVKHALWTSALHT